MPDKERYDKALKSFQDHYWNSIEDCNESSNEYWYRQYLEFSRFIQGIFISENGYIVDTGCFETVNMELMSLIKEKVEKHPYLFSLLFMVD